MISAPLLHVGDVLICADGQKVRVVRRIHYGDCVELSLLALGESAYMAKPFRVPVTCTFKKAA